MCSFKLPDIDPDKVDPLKDVISSDEHPQIGHRDVFQTSDNCRGQRGVVLRAENNTCIKNEAHETTQEKVREEHEVCPAFVVHCLQKRNKAQVIIILSS